MAEYEKALACVYNAADEMNDTLPPDGKLEKSPETVIFGKDGKLDSLGIVNFIVAVEEQIEEEFDVELTLADENASAMEESPFATMETLAKYVAKRVEEES
jgi:acyl carrier protein